MAEDGMLMNFSLEDEAFNTKPIYKGGRWKDRLTAKKRAQHRQQRAHEAATNTGSVNTEALPDEAIHSAKRQKTGEATRHVRATGTKEVVSSLFTYNPTSKLPPVEVVLDETLVKPSNAPLLDGLDTFTSLGLSTTLAIHLLTKLNLKAPTAIQVSTITQLLKEDSDAFIQAETGSGKTLAYLLPIVERIMKLSKKDIQTASTSTNGQIHRDSGLFAIILAPTRELCKQTSVVLESLLRCANWIVAGTVLGGEKKKSEKARLRKGLNILVATPGRLIDHLENTEVLDVSNVRWLVLDEGDRLMELGFEEDIKGIVNKLSARKRGSTIPGLPKERTTVLCSATMKMTVQKLGEISLKDAVHIKADPEELNSKAGSNGKDPTFSAPAQLKQSYIVVPTKQRLVTLAAYLKRTFARHGSVMKAIVFLSCADSVDFHFELFSQTFSSPETNGTTQSTNLPPLTTNVNSDLPPTNDITHKPSPPLLTTSTAPFLSRTLLLHKLHGSLPQPIRTSTLRSFTRTNLPSILLCTDVASRGLDLPNIDLVIEYDPPFSSSDHLHRVGRTARAGREGRACCFLTPGAEEGYVEVLQEGCIAGLGRNVVRREAEEVLQKGFTSSGKSQTTEGRKIKWSDLATEFQLGVERWIVEDKKAGEMARRAFTSHVRAYATHVAKERDMFDVKALHLGHLAKAFGLRERPGNMGRGEVGKKDRRASGGNSGKASSRSSKGEDGDNETRNVDGMEANRKMRMKMKEHMAGASEFNIG